MNDNTIWLIVIATAFMVAIFAYNKYLKNRLKLSKLEENRYDFANINKFIKDTFNDILKVNLYEMNLSKEEFDKKMHNKHQLRKALKNCTYGDLNAKNYIKHFIRDILMNRYLIDEDNIDEIIPFKKAKYLTTQDQFEILLHIYKKKHGLNALEQLILDYHLDQPLEHKHGIRYMISKENIENISRKISPIRLTFADKLAIVTQRIYQDYDGGIIGQQ